MLTNIKMKLRPNAFQKAKGKPWELCAPFVDNRQAQLIHRPRNVTEYWVLGRKHIAVHAWCGNGSTGDRTKYTFLNFLDGEKLVCARCENAAVLAGLFSSDVILGRHVHKGKLVPKQTCCVATVNKED